MSNTAFVEDDSDRIEEPDARFRVAGSFAVRAILRELMAQATAITLHPDGRRSHPIPARIIAVDADSFEVEVSGLSKDATALCSAGFVVAATAPATIETRFRVDGMRLPEEAASESVRLERAILAAPLPPEVYRCQRRDSFRVYPPAEDRALCVQRVSPGYELHHPIVDLSAGGLSLRLTGDELPPQPGAIWTHGRIEVRDAVLVPCDLLVCGAYDDDETSARDVPGRRIAFAFHHMPGEALRGIQRYVIDVEKRCRIKPACS